MEKIRIPATLVLLGKIFENILCCYYGEKPVLRIRIHRIHMFLGLPDPDPDPLVRGMDPDPALDPDPSIIMQK